MEKNCNELIENFKKIDSKYTPDYKNIVPDILFLYLLSHLTIQQITK